MALPKDITNKKYNKLTALRFSHIQKSNRTHYWVFKCDCGKETTTSKAQVTGGFIKSCCGNKETRFDKTHGMSETSFYKVWRHMRDRCIKPQHQNYSNYGARGITICKRWLKFENFRDDMLSTYLIHCEEFNQKETSIDRINNEKGYSPENCRWATRKEQSRNIRSNRILSLNGVNKTMAEWTEMLGGSKNLIGERLKNNWSIKEASTTLVQ